MLTRRTSVWVALAFASVASLQVGCRNDRDVVVVRPEPEPSVTLRESRHDALDIGTVAARIAAADDRHGEADALKQLREFMVQEGMTYEVRTTTPDGVTEVPAAAITAAPVRATVTVFRGRERVHTFHFVPKDNENLRLLGQ